MKNSFVREIMNWYAANRRSLPWRDSKDPYKVWVSEIILQQTRVNQGLPYYLRFMEAFPDVYSLASAPIDKVLKIWQGLGYYSRVQNMRQAAIQIVEGFDGKFPESYDELRSLKGVGDYTASAVASICFGKKTPVLDGNVYRVMARYFGIYTPVPTGESRKIFKKYALELIPSSAPGDYNQAVMEFGALLCTPASPDCTGCPLHTGCRAFRENNVAGLPVKIRKKPVKKRYFEYFVFHSADDKTILHKRNNRDIWKGLYQFPLVENAAPQDLSELTASASFKKLTGNMEYTVLPEPYQYLHKLTHRDLHIRFWIIHTRLISSPAVSWKHINEYPVPVVIKKFIREYLFPKEK